MRALINIMTARNSFRTSTNRIALLLLVVAVSGCSTLNIGGLFGKESDPSANTQASEAADNSSKKQRFNKKKKWSVEPWVKPYQRGYLVDPLMDSDRDILFEQFKNTGLAQFEIIRQADAKRAIFFNQSSTKLPSELSTFQTMVLSSKDADIFSSQFWAQTQLYENYSLSFGQTFQTKKDQPSDIYNSAYSNSDKRSTTQVSAAYGKGPTLVQTAYVYTTDDDEENNGVDAVLSQTLFGEMTTIVMGFTRNWDVAKRFDNERQWDRDYQQLRFGVHQVLTQRIKMFAEFQQASHKGELENVYRTARVGGGFLPESVPDNKVSRQWELSIRGYIDPSMVLEFSLENYEDTWDMKASSYTLTSRFPIYNRWVFDLSYRHYQQDASLFYANNAEADLTIPALPRYYSFGKEYAEMKADALSVSARYRLPKANQVRKFMPFFDQIQLQFSESIINYSYKDYQRLNSNEPYDQLAHIIQAELTAWF